MKRHLAGLFGALFAVCVAGLPAQAEDTNNNVLVPIQSDTATMGTTYVGSRHIAHHLLMNSSGNETGVQAVPIFVRLSDGTNPISTLPVSIASSVSVTNAGTFATQSAITAASGSIASGAVASGAFASGSVASGAFASGSLAAGSMVDLLTMRGTVSNGTAAANSLLTGAVYNSTQPTLTTGQQAAVQVGSRGSLLVQLMNADSATPANLGTTSLTGVTAAGTGLRVISPMYLSNGTTIDQAVSGAGAVGAGVQRTTQASDSPLVTATGAVADAAWTSGSGSVIAVLKAIAGGITSSIITTGTDASPSSTTVVPTHVRPHAAMLTKAAVSFSSSGDNTVVTRATGTIKVYRLMMACDSEVTVTYKNGTGTALSGAMKTKDVYLPFEDGEPHFTTTSTNNFVINLGGAVQCSGTIAYLDT